MSDKSLSWWDPYSNQPYRLSAGQKPRRNWPTIREYLTIALTAVGCSPALVWRFAMLKPQLADADAKDFVGLSVSPDPAHDEAVYQQPR